MNDTPTTTPPRRITQRTGIRGLKDRLLSTPAGNILIAFCIIQILCVGAALMFPDDFRYLSAANLSVLMKAIPTLGIVALGVGFLMIAGEFDLSVGSIYAFTAVVACMLLAAGVSAWIAAPLMLALGAAISMANGVLSLRFALPSFIVSLGAMLFWKGMIFYVHGAQAIKFEAEGLFLWLLAGKVGPVEVPFIWLIALTFLFHMMLRHHRFGNLVLAVGGNRQAATANGVDPARIKLMCFALAGACASLSGLISAARVGSVTPAQGGGLELQAIAAAVIGGVALTGGRGSMIGVFLGAALIYTIQDVLLLMRAPGFYLDIFVGALIVLAAIANQVVGRRSAR